MPRNYPFSPPNNPLLQILYFAVGGVLLIGAVLMSAVILAFVLGAALIVGLVIFVRVWWLNRKLSRQGTARNKGAGRSTGGEVIEVEYTVVSEQDDQEPQD